MNQTAQNLFLKFISLVLILALTVVSGCFDSEDLDRRMIVSPIGIDSQSRREISGSVSNADSSPNN